MGEAARSALPSTSPAWKATEAPLRGAEPSRRTLVGSEGVVLVHVFDVELFLMLVTHLPGWIPMLLVLFLSD